jgi:hypothetical protein
VSELLQSLVQSASVAAKSDATAAGISNLPGRFRAVYNSLYGSTYLPFGGGRQLCPRWFCILMEVPTD